jgi:hypothetical protein
MRSIIFFPVLLLLTGTLSGQWKAQTAEEYDKTTRMAYVTSTSGNETLRILRDVSAQTGASGMTVYEQLTGLILLNQHIGDGNRVHSLVLRFDESPKIYIHQPEKIKQQWDPNLRKFMIESDWQLWRIADTRDKSIRKETDPASLPPDERLDMEGIITLLKASQKVTCQIILLNSVYDTQSILKCEFTLQNSTKSINFLLK